MIAHNMAEFQEMFRIIPESALTYHGQRNSFSTWLMARGEINIAEQLLPRRLEDFKNANELRQFCLNVFEKERIQKLRGTIIDFDQRLFRATDMWCGWAKARWAVRKRNGFYVQFPGKH